MNSIYQIGDSINVKVYSIVPFGMYVRLPNGSLGVILTVNLPDKIQPSDYEIGQEIQAVVLRMIAGERIDLGMREEHYNCLGRRKD